eukprot:CAMPEP_0113303220 /NCGR_PEP_ID=MMETSP0010_2-20120614/3729_1 /TAXON_ID=216773 ORGANISM="Corethron hystrix, Strain 308" /NCGR_SAMPLE_ID=MMETSP0010_2 /ASSEMBLY_ACC=CAM_ASM_000155 /LENGTH=372 /DNA_ID=CAMNT_0000157185 /DNA_START=83 /DNA_END=1201 /DNA_ORIENTATION=+ /assembly_acc=CAM_ASM_000155
MVEVVDCCRLSKSTSAFQKRNNPLTGFHSGTVTNKVGTIFERNRYYRSNDVHSSKTLFAAAKEREGFFQVSRLLETTDDTAEKRGPETREYNLHYKIARPMNLSSRKAAPLVVLHGGPSVPSDYLYPLAECVGGPMPYRSVVFFDQLGCGRSDEPTDLRCYSIALALDDLEVMLKQLNLRKFHLYGQSFGGILAFEYAKRVAERRGSRPSDDANDDNGAPQCLSVILSSAPTDVKMVEQEADKIVAKLMEEDDDKSTLAERFRLKCQCRVDSYPEPLKAAYDRAGTFWRGTAAIPEYVAHPPTENAEKMPSALVIRGEFDFVSPECVRGWKSTAFNHQFVREKTLSGCSHHGLLENGAAYGEMVDSFCSEYD